MAAGLCIKCNYDLHSAGSLEQASNLCPECGRAFDPHDRSTLRGPSGAICWREWACYPTMIEVVIAISAAALRCYAYSAPGVPFTTEPQFAGILAIVSTCLLWFLPALFVVRLAAIVADRKRAALDRVPFQCRSRWRLVVFGLALILGTGDLLTNWSLRLRFAMSEPPLMAEVKSRTWQGGIATGYLGWRGLFHIEQAWSDSGGDNVQLKVVGSEPAGICYWPHGPVGGRYIHLKGPWFAVEFR